MSEWIAYYHLEPWGQERADLRSAQIAAIIAETNRDSKKRSKPFTAADFMPDFDRQPKKAQTQEQQKEVVRILHAAFGGTEEKK